MEDLNSVFSATQRKARGYRSTAHFTAMRHFTAGKFSLLQFWFYRRQRGTGIRWQFKRLDFKSWRSRRNMVR